MGNSKLNIIEEGDPGFDEKVGKRGLPDVVSPVMEELLDDMLAAGTTVVQLKADDPFTVSQLRYWQPKGNAYLAANDAEYRVGVSGGKDGKNISVELKSTNGSDEEAPKARKTPTKRQAPKAKKAPAKKAAKRPAKRKAVAK